MKKPGAMARLGWQVASETRAEIYLISLCSVCRFRKGLYFFFSIRSVMRVSRGIVTLSNGMNALAKGEKDVGPPSYTGPETELIRLLDAFRAFHDSVDRVSRLRRTAEAAARTIRSTFRNMNEGIALFDPAGRPITMNRRIIELVGRSGSSRKLPLRRFVEPIPEIDPALLPFDTEPGELLDRAVVRHMAVGHEQVL